MSELAASIDVTCYYYTPQKAPLLAGAILPAVRAASSWPVLGHVERHWLHGPHVRVRLRGPAADTEAAAVRTAEQVRAYLSDHPSASDLDVAALLDRSRASGLAELVPGPYEPIYPDNTVRISAGEDGHIRALLGSPLTVERRADVLRAGLDAVGSSVGYLTERGNSPGSRVWLALTAMAVHAAAYPPGIAGGYHSFLSHLEDFFYLSDPGGRLRAGFEREWSRRREAVTARVAAIAGGQLADADCLVAAWTGWAGHAWAICAPAWRRGELPMPGEEYSAQARRLGAAALRRWDPRKRVGHSEYHTMLFRTDFFATPGIAEHFGPYRFATNVLYQLLVLCDVTPLERYLAAYLLSQAVPELTGMSWRETMAAYARDGDAGTGTASGGAPQSCLGTEAVRP